MGIILINSPLYLNQDDVVSEHFLLPIGLGYIATYLANNDVNVTIIDSVNENLSVETLQETLNLIKPKFIGVNVFSTNYNVVKELIENIAFECHIIIGGLSTKALYQQIVEWDSINKIDIVIGDGEYIILDIIRDDVKESAFYEESKRRVFLVDKNSIYYSEDISNISLDRKLFLKPYSLNILGENEINIVTSRGCVYNCSYCAAARSQNRNSPVRLRSVDSIKNELIEIKQLFPETESIRILDDLFLKSKQSIIEAINIFSEFDFNWRAMAHINTFSKIENNLIYLMKQSGCSELFIGIESGSNEIRQKISKFGTRDMVLENISRIFESGIKVKGYFIYGFPDESLEDMEQTYQLAKEIKDLSIKYNVGFRASVFQFRLYHGTEIFKSLLQNGKITNEDFLTPSPQLTNLIGRKQFNFQSKNFSNVCIDTILDYICRTNSL
ncbi:MAG: radical SAM protein [Bacteroidales bacterium]|nr:radical SAM protein [Bacteroidales bacterium]MDD3859297.1 radical SAM protein [Bacteroidales bacterium]